MEQIYLSTCIVTQFTEASAMMLQQYITYDQVYENRSYLYIDFEDIHNSACGYHKRN